MIIISLTLLSLVFYILGLFTPLYTSTHFYIFSKESTLAQSILLLFKNHELYLGILILLFTILLPLIKFTVVVINLLSKDDYSGNVFFRFISIVSKWSMLDVFVVAVLLLNMKFDSRIIDMKLGSGIIWFSLSIILLMISVTLFDRKRSAK